MTLDRKIIQQRVNSLKSNTYSYDYFDFFAKRVVYGNPVAKSSLNRQAVKDTSSRWNLAPWYAGKDWYHKRQYLEDGSHSMANIPELHPDRIQSLEAIRKYAKKAAKTKTDADIQAAIACFIQLKKILALALPGKNEFEHCENALNQLAQTELTAPLVQALCNCLKHFRAEKAKMTDQQKAVLTAFENHHSTSLFSELFQLADLCQSNLRFLVDPNPNASATETAANRYHQNRQILKANEAFTGGEIAAFAVLILLIAGTVAISVCLIAFAPGCAATAVQQSGALFLEFLPILMPTITAGLTAIGLGILGLCSRARRKNREYAQEQIDTLLNAQEENAVTVTPN